MTWAGFGVEIGTLVLLAVLTWLLRRSKERWADFDGPGLGPNDYPWFTGFGTRSAS